MKKITQLDKWPRVPPPPKVEVRTAVRMPGKMLTARLIKPVVTRCALLICLLSAACWADTQTITAPQGGQGACPFPGCQGQTAIFDATLPPYNAYPGAPDNTAALQAAARACETAGGGIIYLPAGLYNTGQWTVGSHCTVQGAGMGATTVKCLPTEPNVCIHASAGQKKATNASNYGTPVSGVGFQDFTLDANGTARIQAGLGGYVRGLVVAHQSDHILIRNLRFLDGGSRALEVNPSRSVWVSHNSCERSSHVVGAEGDCLHVGNPCMNGAREPPGWCNSPAKLAACQDVHMTRNFVLQTGDTPISVQYCFDVDIGENIVRGDETVPCSANADCGPAGTCGGGLPNVCTPTTDESGIEFTGSQRVRVHDNEVNSVRNSCVTTSSFIDPFGHEWPPDVISVTNNLCIRNLGLASTPPSIRLQGGTVNLLTNAHVDGNTIINSPTEAISFPTQVQNFTISHNVITNTGLQYAAGATDAAIRLGTAISNPVTQGVVDHNYIQGPVGKLFYCIFEWYTGAATVISISDTDCINASNGPLRAEGSVFFFQPKHNTSAQVTYTNLSSNTFLGNAAIGSMAYCVDCTYNATTGLCNTGGVGTAGRMATKRDNVTGNWCCQSGMSQTAGTLLTTCG